MRLLRIVRWWCLMGIVAVTAVACSQTDSRVPYSQPYGATPPQAYAAPGGTSYAAPPAGYSSPPAGSGSHSAPMPMGSGSR